MESTYARARRASGPNMFSRTNAMRLDSIDPSATFAAAASSSASIPSITAGV